MEPEPNGVLVPVGGREAADLLPARCDEAMGRGSGRTGGIACQQQLMIRSIVAWVKVFE
jgi:hypothetical protein